MHVSMTRHSSQNFLDTYFYTHYPEQVLGAGRFSLVCLIFNS